MVLRFGFWPSDGYVQSSGLKAVECFHDGAVVIPKSPESPAASGNPNAYLKQNGESKQ